MWKFKSWKGKDKWLFLLTIGVILCILAIPTGSGSGIFGGGDSPGSAKQTGAETEADGAGADAEVGAEAKVTDKAIPSAAKPASAYEQQLEQRVKDILKNVDGVGEVEVMIVLRSSAEKVIHVDGSSSRSVTDETDSSGGARKIESEEQETSTVLTTAGGNNGPIVEKELYPEISGIVISASGGGSPRVQEEISSAMQALFGLPAHKIKVLKRVE